MAFPQVGVEAIVKGFDKFQGDMAKVRKEMADTGHQASATAGAMGKSVGGLAGALGGMLVVAGGIIAADIFRAMASGLKTFASDALEAASSLQQLEVRFTTLAARELAAVNTGAGFTDWLRESTDLSDSAIQRYENLRAKHEELTDALVGVREGTTAWKNYTTQLQATDDQIRQLLPGFDSMDVRMQQAAFGTYSFQQALKDASGSAEEMVDWAVKLAITTPFTTETVAGAAALTMAMGYTQDQAQRLTTAVSNFTAGMGLTDEVMSRIIHNFGQMKAAGKVTGTELRDLARGGMVPVNDVLVEMQRNLGLSNMSFAQFKKGAGEGKYGVQPFVDAFLEIIERDFAGAAERLSRTWSGATSNLKEFFQVIMGGQVLKPVLDNVAAGLADLIDILSEPAVVASMKNTGLYLKTIWDNVGGMVGALLGLDSIEPGDGLKAFENVFRGIAMWTVRIEALLTGKTTLRDMLDRLYGKAPIPQGWEVLMGFFKTLGTLLGGIGAGIGAALGGIFAGIQGAAPGAGATVMESVTEGLQYFTNWYADHKDALNEVGIGIGSFFNWLGTDLVPLIIRIGSSGAAGTLLGIGQALLDFVGILLDLGTGDWDQLGVDVGAFISNLGNALLQFPLAIANEVFSAEWFQGFAQRMYEGSGLQPPANVMDGLAAWSGVFDNLKVIFDSFATSITGGLSAWSGVFANMATIINVFAAGMVAKGTAVVQGFWNGMRTKWAAFKSWLEGIIQEAISLWNKLLGLGSPSKVMMDVGKNVVQGLQIGMSRQFAGAERVMARGAAGIAASPMMASAPSQVTNNRSVTMGSVNINTGRDETWFDTQMRKWLGG